MLAGTQETSDHVVVSCSMKVLFLDIDGVLNGDGTKDRIPPEDIIAMAFPDAPYVGVFPDKDGGEGMTGLCPSLLTRLQRIVGAVPDAEIILSSSWRKRFPLFAIENLMAKRGFDIKIAGKTPNGDGHRGREILAWLETRPDVRAFVILEDGHDIDPPLTSHWVAPNSRTGLSDMDVEGAIRILRRNMPLIDKTKPMCCMPDCGKLADWDVRWGTSPDDYTHSCISHVNELLEDGKVNTLTPIAHEGAVQP